MIEIFNKNEKDSCLIRSYEDPLIVIKLNNTIDKKIFFGDNLAFNLLPTNQKFLKFYISIVAAHYDYYFDPEKDFKQKCKSLSCALKCLVSSKKRSKKIVHAYENSTSEFIRETWRLFESETYLKFSRLRAYKVQMNEKFRIIPDKLFLKNLQGKLVEIPIPTAHIGEKPIICHLMSKYQRCGMVSLQTHVMQMMKHFNNFRSSNFSLTKNSNQKPWKYLIL